VIAYLYKGKQIKKRGVAMNSKEKPITTELEDEPTTYSISMQMRAIEALVFRNPKARAIFQSFMNEEEV
jgi:hypothetical protein